MIKINKIIKRILFESSIGLIIVGLIIIVPILMLLDFFGADITDDYIEGNQEYASEYIEVAKNFISIGKGYVSLNRILYFYLEDDLLSFEEIYQDNLDQDLKQIKPISEVCKTDKYKNYFGCKEENLTESNQIDDIQNKPFTAPIDIENMLVSSFFMEERIINNKFDIHTGWDFASKAGTPVYSVCDGTVIDVSFPYSENAIDLSGGGGNTITINCSINDNDYEVNYLHLFPNSSKVKVGDKVVNWEQIATVGTTGYSTGNHLHFEVKLGGISIDGMSLIDFTIENEKINIPGKFN